jgi:hypothetical protein
LSGTTLMQPVNTESCFVPVDQHNKGLDAQFIARAPVQLLADGWHSSLYSMKTPHVRGECYAFIV